ncbi:MAG: hypothetical protein ACRDYU_04445 [Actinomycetes bacterium]
MEASEPAPVPDTEGLAGEPPTGDVRVDEAVRLLEPLGELEVDHHVPVFDEVHRRLRETLATLDGG